MDFIARAGSMLDRAHRIAGLLLVLCVIEGVAILHFMSVNGNLNRQFANIREELKVYVVPGSKADIYGPTNMTILMETFVDHITQSLKTFTYETFESQQAEISRFFVPKLRSKWKKQASSLISKIEADERSSLFVPYKDRMKISKLKDRIDGKVAYKVIVEGDVSHFIGGSLIETVPLVVNLVLQRRNLSKANPFGFVLVKYNEKGKY
jgi:6,7-dimethyl-8-ribityllumazine synthase